MSREAWDHRNMCPRKMKRNADGTDALKSFSSATGCRRSRRHLLLSISRNYRCPPHDPNPPPPHPWTRPIPPPIKLPKSALEEKLDQIRKSPLRFLDMGSIAKASFNAVREFIDPTVPGPELEKAQDDLANDLRDFWEEEKRKRDNRTKDPPGDPDPD